MVLTNTCNAKHPKYSSPIQKLTEENGYFYSRFENMYGTFIELKLFTLVPSYSYIQIHNIMM